MRRVLYYIGMALLSLFFASCEDQIELDLPEGEVGLVVDGMVTTQDGPQVIRLSLTTNFNNDGETPKVVGAVVKVLDNQGGVFVFSEVEPGKYESSAAFKGVVGNEYHLEIDYNGEKYQSGNELLQKAPVIENIRYYFLEDELFTDDGYYVYFDFQENPSEENAFRIVQYYDGEIANQPSDIVAFDDEFFNGLYIDSLSFNETLEKGDAYEVQLWSLSAGAKNFIDEVSDQAGGTGGPFDVPPAPIYGNVFNVNDPNELVWGYFSASDISADSVTINP